MRYSLAKITTVVALSVLSIGTANAALIQGTYTVVGSNFTSTGAASPFLSITESFTITFDNTALVSQKVTGISLNPASTIVPTSTLGFTYVPGVDSLVVGGLAGTVATADTSTPDFSVTIGSASTPGNFTISALSYTTGNGATYSALTRTVGTPPVSAVPEPASLVLLGSAAAAIAFVRRRKNHG